MKRRVTILIKKGALDELSRKQRFEYVTKTFVNTINAVGQFVAWRISKNKKEFRKMVITLEMR
jgi:hypothetical protein